MMRSHLFVLFAFALTILAGLPVKVEAQSRYYYEMRDAIYGRGRAYPVRQGRGYGYDDPRMMDPCYGADQFYQGMRGTMHAHKGQTHFRPCDPTNSRTSTMGGGVLGAGGGAAIGGAFGGRKGASIGAVGGAIVGGVITSRNTHDNCIVMPPVQYDGSGQEQAMSQPVATSRPVDPLTGITWPTVNTTDFRAVVTDPNSGKEKLVPAGGSMNLPEPEGEQPYVVVLLAPGRGSIDRVPGEIRPSQDLQGWEIVAR